MGGVLDLALLGFLAAMGLVDAKRRCLPRFVLLAFVAFCAVAAWLEAGGQGPDAPEALQVMAGRLVAPVVITGALRLLERLVVLAFRQEGAMGAGDYYVVAGLALALEPERLLVCLMVASLAPVAAYSFRRFGLKEKAPDKTFAWVPYLCLGVLVALASG